MERRLAKDRHAPQVICWELWSFQKRSLPPHIQRLYREKQAIDNVKEILLRNIAILKKEQAAGENRTDEILYMEQFLKELEKDKIGYIRDVKYPRLKSRASDGKE